MGLFERRRQRPAVPGASYRVVEGSKALEVVGESHYQDALWRVAGGQRHERIRQPVVAVLQPDPKNQYDPRAVAIYIDGMLVGHLPKTAASVVFAPLSGMYQQINPGEYIAVRGEVVGGSDGSDGRAGNLGVFLRWDPGAFGIKELPSGTNPSAASWAGQRATAQSRPTDATLVKTAARLVPVVAENATKAQAEALARSLDALEVDLRALADDLAIIGPDASGKLLAQRLSRYGFDTHEGPTSAQYVEDLDDELGQLVGSLEDLVNEWAGADREDKQGLRWEASGNAEIFTDRINERRK